MHARLSTLLALAILALSPAATASGAIRVADNHVAHARARSSAGGPSRRGLMAPADLCPGQAEADASSAAQVEAMRCMVDFARRGAGLPPLSDSERLDRSAGEKSADILRCDEFSHYACGRPFDFWIEKVGYLPARCWRVGENIAWMGGDRTSVRDVFDLLIHSPPHRANLLGPYSEVGIALRSGDLDGHGDAHVWTQDFGTHC
jgi:uncharacterized protein YkwD